MTPFLSENSNPYLSVDCVIFGFDGKQLNVLLLERKMWSPDNSIFVDDKTLIGNHVNEAEDFDQAASRILKEITGLHDIYLEQFSVFGNPKRLQREKDQLWIRSLGLDPFKRIISVGYFSLINVQAEKYKLRKEVPNPLWHGSTPRWYPVDNLDNMAFDHQQIFEKALHALREKVKNNQIGFELLPDKFTLSQLQKLYEIILDTQFDKRNFRKKLGTVPYIVPLDETETDVKRKAGRLYMFDKQLYDKYKDENLSYSF